jgi:hypothetical protein
MNKIGKKRRKKEEEKKRRGEKIEVSLNHT